MERKSWGRGGRTLLRNPHRSWIPIWTIPTSTCASTCTMLHLYEHLHYSGLCKGGWGTTKKKLSLLQLPEKMLGVFFTFCSQASSADSRDWKFYTGSQLHVFTKTDLSCTMAADRIQENATAHEMRTVCPSSLILYTSEVHVICLGWNASTSSCCLNQTISTSCMWNLHFSRGSKKKKKSNEIISLYYIKPNPPPTWFLRRLNCACSWLQRRKGLLPLLFPLVIFTPSIRGGKNLLFGPFCFLFSK